jgi:hypothetical protein
MHFPDDLVYRAIPRAFSPIPDDVDLSAAHLGATHLDLPLMPQGVQVAQLLEALREDGKPLYRRVGLQFSRRSQKTTSIAALLLGRCLTIPGYRVISTAQDGTRASVALKEVMWILQAQDPDGVQGLWDLRWSNGGEAIHFANGSRWERRVPKATAFRGAAADALWFDEAGEYSPDLTDELIQGALPLMDTRPHGQVIISGTPAVGREGLLWDTLKQGLDGKRGVGLLDYGMEEDDDPTDEDVWWRCHPGLASGLTDIDVIRERFEQMPLPAFMVEYLGYWPKHSFDHAIEPEDWTRQAESLRSPTGDFVLGLDVSPDSSSACLVAAWRDELDVAHVSVVDHRPGTDWLPKKAYELLKKYPRLRVTYDEIGAVREPVEILLRERNIASRVIPTKQKDIQAGQANLVRVIAKGDVFHPDQPSLNAAVDGLRWKNSAERGRWFGWGMSTADIGPIRAAAIALWFLDQNKRKKTVLPPNA